MKRAWIICLVCLLGLSVAALAKGDAPDQPLAIPQFSPAGIELLPQSGDSAYVLTIALPDGTVIRKSFDSGQIPAFSLGDIADTHDLDGTYTYELVRVNMGPVAERADSSTAGEDKSRVRSVSQTGHFRVLDGWVVTATDSVEDQAALKDVVYTDDVIVQYSLCVGVDCVNNENFGFDTIRLKENNLRIHFDDTSSTGAFPSNDWRIIINDSNNGGASYFSVEDSTAGRRPFTIEAGAKANALYVDDYGRVGLGTATPVTELHINDSDTPTVRLEQNSSGGWTPQTWDVAGNEANFFIRDVTNGSKLPFRIQPGTPMSTLCLRADGNVGIGTWAPSFPLEVQTTGSNASIVVKRTDGATNYFNATATFANIGSVSDHPLRLAVNGAWRMRLDNDDSLTMSNNAVCTAGGQWLDASSRSYKDNIHNLSAADAEAALDGLQPVTFNYKNDADEQCVGFIAEDVPDLVATKTRKNMSPMDVVAVLTKVVQEQQKMVRQQQQTISELQQKVEELEKAATKK